MLIMRTYNSRVQPGPDDTTIESDVPALLSGLQRIQVFRSSLSRFALRLARYLAEGAGLLLVVL
jgi:hypothetical protein